MLESGIKITVASNAVPANRFWLNSGTRLVPAAPNYLPNSFLPKQDWRAATSTELEQLTRSAEGWNLGEQIGIVKIPDALTQPLRQIVHSHADLHQAASHPDSQSVVQSLANYLQRYSIYGYEVQPLGIHASRPGLITTTMDEQRYLPRKPHVGLHLDSWDNAPLRRRHLSKNRISINLGERNRYFLLINLSLLKIFDLLELSDVSKYYRGVQLPAMFMQRFPDYPVVKIALAPNEAYIAPTENFIHDASTLDKQELDVSFTCLGKFGLMT
jgi:hypothetical protein